MNSNLPAIVKPFGGVVLADNATHQNRFEIPNSTGARRYVVAQMIRSGEWQCSCPGWVLKKAGRERSCKHLRAMGPALGKISALKAGF